MSLSSVPYIKEKIVAKMLNVSYTLKYLIKDHVRLLSLEFSSSMVALFPAWSFILKNLFLVCSFITSWSFIIILKITHYFVCLLHLVPLSGQSLILKLLVPFGLVPFDQLIPLCSFYFTKQFSMMVFYYSVKFSMVFYFFKIGCQHVLLLSAFQHGRLFFFLKIPQCSFIRYSFYGYLLDT